MKKRFDRKRKIFLKTIKRYLTPKNGKNANTPLKVHWLKIYSISFFSCYLYVFLEWLFFATKFSFLTKLDLSEKYAILFASSIISFIPVLFLVLCCHLIERFFNLKIFYIVIILPCIIIACMLLLAIDNFTYTILELGVRFSSGLFNVIYIVCLSIIFISTLNKLIKLHEVNWNKSLQSALNYAMIILTLMSFISFFSLKPYRQVNLVDKKTISIVKNRKLPNILVIGTDGIKSDDMSLYGYYRKTTPFIDRFSKDALVFENAFANADNTAGSLTSMMTGKHPTVTKVIYAPDILTGVHSFEHLPGILKQLGYRTVSINLRYFADPYDFNMRNAFDVSNGRSRDQDLFFHSFLGINNFYFIEKMTSRILSRLKHIFWIKTMSHAVEEVFTTFKAFKGRTGKASNLYLAKKRWLSLIKELKTSSRPFFIQAHFLGTHGPFYPWVRRYSKGKGLTGTTKDFFDDTLLTFDYRFGNIIKLLRSKKILSNTLIVFYSDHTGTSYRSPLIIWFPNRKFTGYVKNNVQNLDVAPTILDFINVPMPEFMNGNSLISKDLSMNRPIWTIQTESRTGPMLVKNKKIDTRGIIREPPYFNLGGITVRVCNRGYTYMIKRNIIVESIVKNHTQTCKSGELPDQHEIKKLIVDHLINNYSTTSIDLKQITFEKITK